MNPWGSFLFFLYFITKTDCISQYFTITTFFNYLNIYTCFPSVPSKHPSSLTFHTLSTSWNQSNPKSQLQANDLLAKSELQNISSIYLQTSKQANKQASYCLGHCNKNMMQSNLVKTKTLWNILQSSRLQNSRELSKLKEVHRFFPFCSLLCCCTSCY